MVAPGDASSKNIAARTRPLLCLVPYLLPRETSDAPGSVGCSAGPGSCPVLTGDALDAWLPHWDLHSLSNMKATSLL